MKLKKLVSEGFLSRTFQAAAESWGRQDYEQYFEIMERASRLDPANDRVLFDLGLAYGMRYDFAAAERCLDKAIRVAPQKAAALAMAGTHCRNFSHYEMARHYFESAIKEPSASSDSLIKLAEIYERFRLM